MIGVVTTVYNEERYVARAIKSVLEQTVSPFDYVVVNDGSTDRSADIVRGYPDVRLLSISNRGMPGARNAGVAALNPRVEYVMFLDGDDWMEPDAIENLMEFGNKSSWTPDVFVPEYRIWPEGVHCDYEYKYPTWADLLSWCCISYGIIRRRLFIETGGYHPAMNGDCDWDMWVDLLRRGAVLEYIPRVLFNYRQHSGSYTATGNLELRWDNIAEMERHMANPVHIPKKDAHAEYMEEFAKRMERVNRDIARLREGNHGVRTLR